MSSRPLHTLALAGLALCAAPTAAQEAPWDGAAVMELVQRARDARQEVVDDPDFRNYQAEARGWVFFSLDRPSEDVRTAVKTTQLALDVFWRAPRDTRQRIVGMREAKDLPTNIRYHLDHLTVVQDDFDDRIRLGDGDEVEAIVHPMAPGAEFVYEYRLADSLSLSFPGREDPIRVYRVEVRPKSMEAAGLVGSVFLDRATASIVRMSFTFTPASYVDPHLDYIRISLDNALWLGRYWLPYRQEIEIRRELPQLDFVAGSVIGGRFEIGNYRFNEPLPEGLFVGRGVTAAPVAEREAFPFEVPISAGIEEEGLAAPPSLEELGQEARELAAGRVLSGLSGLRLHVGSLSDIARYDRAEGMRLGGGLTLRPRSWLTTTVHAGWAFGRGTGSGRLVVTGGEDRPGTGVGLEWDVVRDFGPVEGAPGLLNSFAALGGRDYLDPWFATGVRLFHRFDLPAGGALEVTARYEDHESAELVVGDARGFRPVRPVDEGLLRAADLGIVLPGLPAEIHGRLDLRLARHEDASYGTVEGHLRWVHERPGPGWRVRADARAGRADEDAPTQELYLLGGRATLPGHPYRDAVGDRFWLLELRVGHTVRHPWVGAHLLASAGRTWAGSDRELPAGWEARTGAGTRASVGAGLDLLWEVIHLDLARGLGDGGDWELILGVHHRFQAWL